MRSPKRLLVTGGAGFMGSSFIRFVLNNSLAQHLVNLDLLTYAGNLDNVAECAHDSRYLFVRGNILDQTLIEKICLQEKIDTIVHFAAETHVDRSISHPEAFLESNVSGTFALLKIVQKMPKTVHFHQISTDEVFGSLGKTGLFTEASPYLPNSPYSASKAAADHFVRSFAHTYGLSVTLSHSSNNYGPHQYPEKFIPRMITACLEKKPLPIYGEGENVRDWLYVDDHAEAVWTVLQKGRRGETYNIGGSCEMKNLDLLHLIIEEVAAHSGEDPAILRKLITFVRDRPGHDFRYALDCTKIRKELGWAPKHSLSEGLKKTINYYLCAPSV